MKRSQKPSVFQIGKVEDNGRETVVSGWALGLCASGCNCHRDPATGALAIDEDQAAGELGLKKFQPRNCRCCEPWTAQELAEFKGDLGTIRGLVVQQPTR